MSRYAERVDEDTVIEYGFDPMGIPGYFYSVEKIKETPEGRMTEVVEAGDTRSMMITHEDEEQMNRSQIAEKLQEYGVRDEHVEAVMADQQF